MWKVISSYRLLNLLSIDIACGAMVAAWFFSQILGIHHFTYSIFSLGITVWIVYTTDHLLDASKITGWPETKRLQLHKSYGKSLFVVLIMASTVDAYLLFHIQTRVFVWGIALAAMVMLYLIFHRWMHPMKEVIGALLYCAGIVLPSVAMFDSIISFDVILIIISFYLTALINLILFSLLDHENDFKQNQSSLVTVYGQRFVENLFRALVIIQSVLCISIFFLFDYKIEISIIGFMNIVLLILFLFPNHFKTMERYRIVGDLIFLFPLPYILFNESTF